MSEILRSYRRNAVHVRQALDVPAGDAGPLHMDGGYLEGAGRIERYKRMSIPVRRALNDSDRASFSQALAELGVTSVARPSASEACRRAGDVWRRLQQELDSTVVLGGAKVPRREILTGWLEAAAFYDTLERDRAYDRLIDQWGKAAEHIGAQLAEEVANLIILLDEAAAEALDEPVILPPPARTPPPPPDPREPWWRRII